MTGALVDEFRARTPDSMAFHKRLRGSLPGGETRAVTFTPPYPVAVAAAEGVHVTDVDGNRYVDLVGNMGSLVHGHRFGPIMDALAEASRTLGTVHAGPHHYQLALAELLVERYPAADLVRFTNSGSEAALLAVRLARRSTRRRRVLIFDGAYHGMGFVDDDPDHIRVPFNDLERAASELDGTIAAVLVEPFLGSAGVIPAAPGFLEGLRRLAHGAGAVFVLDEVQSLRTHLRGHHGATGLDPDLVLMGKIVGGGLPVGVVGGRAELLDLLSATRPDALGHSGTFNGNVFTSAAGYQAMVHLTGERIERLNHQAEQLGSHIERAARDTGLPVSVTRAGSAMCLHFLDRPPRNAADARAGARIGEWFHLAALLEGVYVTRAGHLYLSTQLGDDDLAFVRDALAAALARLSDHPAA
jgi:glutamate-1-semialdehyde 2,1-aminomutase